MKSIIEIKNLWKLYRKGSRSKNITIRENFLKLPVNLFKSYSDSFWALKDINFKIEHGESIGIIGHNGAGKSTLLKILARITPPTRGECILRGNISSMLEIGTGFHPELTGRDNIYLNGSILGMKRTQINRKFDEIVEFSGVQEFIDTPLRQYSSGMQMRLAFSASAFLNAEIILIDEVLTVGDAEFQIKCIRKMEQLSKENGKTIIYVSHDLNLMGKFGARGILLEAGELKYDGPMNEVIKLYLKSKPA